MIRVTYDPRHRRLLMCGHAGSVTKGIDPVCCAASALCYALAENLQWCDPKAQILMRYGYARLQSRAQDTGPLFACFYRGLAKLAKEYPACIQCKRLDNEEDYL